MAKMIKKNEKLWDRDDVQFPRLLAEIVATQELDIGVLCESMSLTVDDIDELLDRAQKAWADIVSETAAR